MVNLSLWLRLPLTLAKLIPSSELDSDDYSLISIIQSFYLRHNEKIEKNILSYIIRISIKESIKLIRKGIDIEQKKNESDIRKIRHLSKILRTIYQEVNDIVYIYQRNKEQKEFFYMIKVYIEKQQIILYKLSSNFLMNRKRIVL